MMREISRWGAQERIWKTSGRPTRAGRAADPNGRVGRAGRADPNGRVGRRTLTGGSTGGAGGPQRAGRAARALKRAGELPSEPTGVPSQAGHAGGP